MNRFFRWVYSDVKRGDTASHIIVGVTLGLESIHLRILSDWLFEYLILEIGELELSHSSSTLIRVSMRICYADSLRSRKNYIQAKKVLEDALYWVERTGMGATAMIAPAETPVGLLNLLYNYAEILSLKKQKIPTQFLGLVGGVVDYFELDQDLSESEIFADQLEEIVNESRQKLTNYYSFIRDILDANQANDRQKSRQEIIDQYLQSETVNALRADARKLQDIELL